MEKITIIGTSHIARQSLEEVENLIKEKKPDIIALELDKKRYSALIHKNKRKINLYSMMRVGFKGFFFALIGAWVEKKLGKLVGITPGSEMLLAIKLAKKNKAKIAFIDQDIEITLRRLSSSITWKERFNFVADVFKGIFFPKKEIEKLGINFDLTKVPAKDVINKLLIRVKERYPNIYNVLLSERNEVMAANLKNLHRRFPDDNILAVVGAGHEDGIKEILEKPNISYTFSVSSEKQNT